MRELPFDPKNDSTFGRLRHIKAFVDLDDDLLAQMMKVASVVHCETGESIIREGEVEHRMYFLVFGECKVTVKGEEVARIKTMGEVFGEMGVIGDKPRSATVTTVRPTVCVAVNADFMNQLDGIDRIKVHAVFYQVFAQVLAERLREMDRKLHGKDKE